MESKSIKQMKNFLFTFLYIFSYLTRGKDICKTVRFCCLATFLRNNMEDKLITRDKN